MSKHLKNKTIFITGSGGLLGKSYIKEFLFHGAKVISTEIKGHRADSLIEQFGENKNFYFYELDITNEEKIAFVFKDIVKYKPNIFINNAAITGELLLGEGVEFPDFSNTKLNDWERAIKVNLTGAFLIAREIDRNFIGNYPLKLINVASMYALKGPHHEIYNDMPFKSFSAYTASKAGIHGLTLWLATYWADKKATVNTIAPGAVFNNHSPEFQKRVSKLIINGKMANPKDIANVMVFLSSESSDYMNGQIINVDGGFSSW